jgi:hypothetical protein
MQAGLWKKGLAPWGQDGGRIARLRESSEFTIYTPKHERNQGRASGQRKYRGVTAASRLNSSPKRTPWPPPLTRKWKHSTPSRSGRRKRILPCD